MISLLGEKLEAGGKGIDLSFFYVNYLYRQPIFNPRIRLAVTRFLAFELKIGVQAKTIKFSYFTHGMKMAILEAFAVLG